jgi:6-phospho-3-hexuloisomerase
MVSRTPTPVAPLGVTNALVAIAAENADIVIALGAAADSSLTDAALRVQQADRVFVLGAGRSGLALRMTAMRLMHLGLDVHVVGETTTPAIKAGDVLLVASGSGTTSAIVRAAEIAAAAGADIVAITTAPDSVLGQLAQVTVVIPAAQKTDHGASLSIQYSGGLFEQIVLLVGDAIFHTLWQASGATAEELWPRHANLE